jgi:hypothetical protein
MVNAPSLPVSNKAGTRPKDQQTPVPRDGSTSGRAVAAPGWRGQQACHYRADRAGATGAEVCRGERTTGPLVLRPVSGKPIDRRDVYRMVQRSAKAARIPRHISPHSLRHAAITNALDAGVPLRDAQILAATPTPGPPNITTAPAATSTVTAFNSSPLPSPASERCRVRTSERAVDTSVPPRMTQQRMTTKPSRGTNESNARRLGVASSPTGARLAAAVWTGRRVSRSTPISLGGGAHGTAHAPSAATKAVQRPLELADWALWS